mgnify:FL=1
MNIRIGHGIDVHQLSKEVPLILGGIKIESTLGIEGHSDGDVVIHALVDALLGALALGDIGQLFPSSDEKFKNYDSTKFLKKVFQEISSYNYNICNIDINIILQKPHINKYIRLMKKKISSILNVQSEQISIKATTTDYLGFVGNSSGIAATATVLILKDEN